MTHRSLFLAGESFSDVQDKLSRCKTDDELKHAMSERLRANGWTREKELSFREHCANVGFILPGQKRPVERNPDTGSKASLLRDAARNDFRKTKTLKGDMEE